MEKGNFLIILMILGLSGCFLLEKSTKDFPELEITYEPNNSNNSKIKEMIERGTMLISSNINIEQEALNRNLTVSHKDFSCVFNREILEIRKKTYKTIGGYFPDAPTQNQENRFIYKLNIYSGKNMKHSGIPPKGFPEQTKGKKDNAILYCQFNIYFYMAKPVVKSNIIEIPFKEFNHIKDIL